MNRVINKGLTVKELSKYCQQQILKGNGDKHIWISQDDEGNGYHRLFYQFLDDAKEIKEMLEYELDDKEKPEEIVILG